MAKLTKAVSELSDLEIHNAIVEAEEGFNREILSLGAASAEAWWNDNWREWFAALCAEQADRKIHSSAAVVRLRFLAGESSRQLDAACGEALGWRVNQDEWWNWHEGPIYDPPGDAWCIRKDARNDVPCNEALPYFTLESFEAALRQLSENSNAR